MTPAQRAEIDAMSHIELARLWRFGETNHPLLQSEAGRHVRDRLFAELKGFTPEISKAIGWSAPPSMYGGAKITYDSTDG